MKMNNQFFGPNRLVFRGPDAQPAAPSAAPMPNPLETARSRESLYRAADAQLKKLAPDSPKRWQLEADLEEARAAEKRSNEDALNQALALNETLARVSGNPKLIEQATAIRRNIEAARREARNKAETAFRNAKRTFIEQNEAAIRDLRPGESLRFVHQGQEYKVTRIGSSSAEQIAANFVPIRKIEVSEQKIQG